MQWVMTTLLITAVLAGVFALYLRQPVDTSKPTFTRQLMDQTGMSQEQIGRMAIKKFSITVADGVAYVREQMSSVQEKNTRFQEYIDAQRDNIKYQGKNLNELMAELSHRRLSTAELTRLKSVADALESQSRLLINQGNQLVEMNQRLHADMERMKDRMEQVRTSGAGQDVAEALDKLAAKQESLMARSRNFGTSAEQWAADVNAKIAREKGGVAGNSAALESIQKAQDRQADILARITNNRLAYEAKQERAEEEAKSKAEKNRLEAEKNEEKLQNAREKAADQREAMRERAAHRSRD